MLDWLKSWLGRRFARRAVYGPDGTPIGPVFCDEAGAMADAERRTGRDWQHLADAGYRLADARPPAPRYMVLTPDNKPVSWGHPTQEAAIKAAETAIGHDWRWMVERGFKLSWS
jgi:hypothetical protein